MCIRDRQRVLLDHAAQAVEDVLQQAEGEVADAQRHQQVRDWIVSHLLMPLGISYFAFRLLQYVFDCLRGVIEENSLLRLAAFVMFIPTFPAGPLETYQGFYEKRSYSFDPQLFYKGLRRIALGYFKKVFVVDFVFALSLIHISEHTRP